MKLDWPPVIGTMPVGPPGTDTTVLLTAPVAGMIVDVLVPLLAGHHGDVGLLTKPQAFLMLGSTRSAWIDAVLDTRLRTTYWSLAATAVEASERLARTAAVVTLRTARACTAVRPPTSTLDRDHGGYARGARTFMATAQRSHSPPTASRAID